MSHQSENCRSVCACVISTPLGAPVVPDVNSTSQTSSPPHRADARVDRRVVDRLAELQERVERVVGRSMASSNPTTSCEVREVAVAGRPASPA